jgi:hypothetical protein
MLGDSITRREHQYELLDLEERNEVATSGRVLIDVRRARLDRGLLEFILQYLLS